MARFSMLVATLLIFAGCGNGGDTSSNVQGLAGTWTGTVTSTVLGSRSISLNLQEANGQLSGTMAIPGVGGGVEGSVSNGVASLRLAVSTGNCTGVLSGPAAITGNTMKVDLSGAFNAPCSCQDGGSATLTR